MKKLWLLASASYLAGCSSQTNSTPEVIQATRATPTLAAVLTPTALAQIPSPTAIPSTVAPETFVAKGFDKEQEVVLRELGKLQKSKPEQDLQVAWQNKDFRFIAVRTVATQVFGVPGDITNPIVQEYGVKLVEGTGDVRFSEEQAKLQKMATEYSIIYNRLLHSKEVQSPSVLHSASSR